MKHFSLTCAKCWEMWLDKCQWAFSWIACRAIVRLMVAGRMPGILLIQRGQCKDVAWPDKVKKFRTADVETAVKLCYLAIGDEITLGRITQARVQELIDEWAARQRRLQSKLYSQEKSA